MPDKKSSMFDSLRIKTILNSISLTVEKYKLLKLIYSEDFIVLIVNTYKC